MFTYDDNGSTTSERTSMPAQISGERTFFVNFGGLIYYTTERAVYAAVTSATAATVAAAYRKGAAKVAGRISIKLGFDAAMLTLTSKGFSASISSAIGRGRSISSLTSLSLSYSRGLF